MLRTERFTINAPIERAAISFQSEKPKRCTHQRGSILIGIIVTIVVMAFLGAGMLSLTTTSTFQELMFGSNTGASSVAESGGRYALSVIRDAYATDMTKLNTINADQTFTLSNGSSFQITDWVQNVTTNPDTITFTSVGIVSSGIFQAKRKIKFGLQPSNQSAAGGGNPPGYGEQTVDLNALAGNVTTGSMGFAVVDVGGNPSLKVTKDQGGGVNAEAYVFRPAANPNPFYTNWVASGGYSIYDLQAKIATGTLSGSNLINPPLDYANGVVFRGIDRGGQQQDFLSVSIVRNGMLVPPLEEPSSWTPWATGNLYAASNIVKFDTKYYQCKLAHTSANGNRPSADSTYWTLLSNDDKAMIILWRRDGNRGNGFDTWMAYKILDQTGKDYIVDGSGYTKNWSTIVVRVIEAASLKLTASSATDINIGDTITGATGTARVFRKINDSDGKVVLLLTNVVGTFTRPGTIGTYGTDPNWGYRSRDNYIWAFYTDVDDHSANTTPLESSGANNVRLGQPRDTINWPKTDVQSWTAADDRFSLVQWNTILNTAVVGEYGATISIMGAGTESGAIIRTDMWTRPGPYASSDAFPGEIGVVSLGGENNAFYDDFAYFIRGGFSGTGGAQGSGSVIQYP